MSHDSFGELFAYTRDLSDSGVYVEHPQLTELQPGMIVSGQVQDLPIPASVLQMEVMRVDVDGVDLRFVQDS